MHNLYILAGTKWKFQKHICNNKTPNSLSLNATKNFIKIKKGDSRFKIFTSPRRGHPTVFEIDSWNFLQMLDLGFSETSQNFSSFGQLFFRKNAENFPKLYIGFFLWYPLENYEKKLSKRAEISWDLRKS